MNREYFPSSKCIVCNHPINIYFFFNTTLNKQN